MWDYRKQIKLAVRVGLELGASKLQVQRSNHSVTLPPKITSHKLFVLLKLLRLNLYFYAYCLPDSGAGYKNNPFSLGRGIYMTSF